MEIFEFVFFVSSLMLSSNLSIRNSILYTVCW
jgi:hypothetical protein